MSSPIEDLFYGELEPSAHYGKDFIKNQGYVKADKAVYRELKKIRKHAPKKYRKAALRLENALGVLSGTETLLSFRCGFQQGARLMTDVFGQD